MTRFISPKEQLLRLERINAVYGLGLARADFPPAPSASLKLRRDEFALLGMYLPDMGGLSGIERTYELVWGAVQPPEGLTKRRDGPRKGVRRAPDSGEYKPGVRWVAINPFAPKELHRKETHPAGIELLVAAMLHPEWPMGWAGLTLAMSGLRLQWLGQWDVTPYLRVEGGAGTGQGILLAGRMHDAPSGSVVYPTVRELG